jgi:hypothetical protein
MRRKIKQKIYSIIILLVIISPISTFAALKVVVKKDKKGFYLVQRGVFHVEQSTGDFVVDSTYYVPLPYKIVDKDTIYDITDYLRPGTGTYFFLSNGTPVTLNVTYTKSEAFKMAEKCAEIEDELEMTRRQLQNTEKARQEEERKRREAERRKFIP